VSVLWPMSAFGRKADISAYGNVLAG